MPDSITIRGARLHNLKNISLSIPKNQLVVLSGVSGSGKSTLGFDILFKEGQRQYMEALGLLTWGLAKPPVDSISGLPPTVSLYQQPGSHSPRSTVGTLSEVYTHLRVLYARLGERPCPHCAETIPPIFDAPQGEWEDESDTSAGDDETQPCPHCKNPVPLLSMGHFSFNKPLGACPTCTGLGTLQQANVSRLLDEQKSISTGAVFDWNEQLIRYHSGVLAAAAVHYGFDFDVNQPVKDYTQIQRDLLLYGVESERFRRHFPGVEPPATVSRGRFEGIATSLLRRYADRIQDAAYREKLDELLLRQTCPDCLGTRLRPESRAVTLHGQPITSLARLPLSELQDWLKALPAHLGAEALQAARPVLEALDERITRLLGVGVGYLGLERSAPSLSAGEAQRLALASLLSSSLSGVLYVFDEPTIGLHPRDTQRLIEVLTRLRELGNSVLVIEHDLEVMRAADTLIDFGPGAGRGGGQVVASGTPDEVSANPASLTGAYLSGKEKLPVPQRRTRSEKLITIRGAREHNLKGIDVSIPLGCLVAVSGVSGSGKSTLIFDTLDRALRQHLYGASAVPGAHDVIEGMQQIAQVITIDQAQLGTLPRSNAATYSDAFTPIREAFALTEAARQKGITRRHFSFNVPGGRCERCQGAGVLRVKMHFLPDAEVHCPACRGRRFTRETLAVRYKGCDIAQVLELTIEDALMLFADVPAVRSRLQVLCDVGLGYLQLGQPADTLSGGEAQRVKLAKELGRRNTGRTLYLLDEPTTGLHLADIARLLGVLQRLVAGGSSVVVIEHNLDLIKAADWVIDLGPEGGAAGGQVIAAGTPEQVAQVERSYTGQYLKQLLSK